MSKIRKKPIDRTTTTISKEEIVFEKAIQYSGWFFLIALSVFLGYWGIFDALLDTIEINIDQMLFSYILFNGTSMAFSFALSTKIRKNRDKKREIFFDWIKAEFILCMFAILSVAVYQW